MDEETKRAIDALTEQLDRIEGALDGFLRELTDWASIPAAVQIAAGDARNKLRGVE